MTFEQGKGDRSGVVIVGAGIAGLTIADLLSTEGIPVTVIERESEVGGLARSFRYGDCIFDIGPHRFHTDNASVRHYIKTILGAKLEDIPRLSGVWFFNKYYDWPLGPMTIIRLPSEILSSVFVDLFSLLSPKARVETFEDHIINMFGKTLYDTFFKEYSTKFLKIPPPVTHSDWAKTGIDRAIIDERLQMKTLWQLIFSLFHPKPDTRFLYPMKGIGQFTKLLEGKIRARVSDIWLDTPVVNVLSDKEKIIGLEIPNHPPIAAEHVIWTAPITKLSEYLNIHNHNLSFLDLILYNVVLTEPPHIGYQWCYYGDSDIIFNRISNPKAFSLSTAPESLFQLCVEVTAVENDSIWENPEQYTDQVVRDLQKVRLISSPSAIKEIYIERIKESYPVYDLEYRQKLGTLKDKLSQYENLTLAGRNGLFWYNNMDHSIENAFQLTMQLLANLT